jgi:2-methylcitrate dehydratase PrpD
VNTLRRGHETSAVARFIATSPIMTGTTREHAGKLLLDALGVAAIARRESSAEAAERALTANVAGPGEASVVGLPGRLGRRDAAMLNGILIHGLDYDDSHGEASVHPTASVLPAALALGEALGRSSDEVMTAYIVGMEVVVRLGAVAPGGFHGRGWHPTGVLGTFGAAAAAARLLRLDEVRTTAALGIALSLGPGTSMEFMAQGSPTKRLHGGAAASAGLLAASLAGFGYEAPTTAFEGEQGLFATYLGGLPSDMSALTDDLGETWRMLEIATKRYPTCHLIHPFIDATLTLRERYEVRAEEVAAVRCGVVAAAMPIIAEPYEQRRRPLTVPAAQFSLPYVVASTLHRGAPGPDDFTLDALDDPAVISTASRVSATALDRGRWTSDGTVMMEMRDGRELRSEAGQVPQASDADALRRKFFANAQPVFGRAGADELFSEAVRVGSGAGDLQALGGAMRSMPRAVGATEGGTGDRNRDAAGTTSLRGQPARATPSRRGRGG